MDPKQNPNQTPGSEPSAEDRDIVARRADRARRLGHRSVGVAVTVLVVVAVLLVNFVVTYAGYSHLWQTDMTVTRYLNMENSLGGGSDDRTLYTLSTPFTELIRTSGLPAVDQINRELDAQGKDAEKIHIIFCAERDTLYDSTLARYVLYTALGLQEEFPDYVEVSFINATQNPSAVQKYKSTSSTNIYSSNVIFEFGTEFRVYAMERFFIQSESTSSEPWAYNGEKEFASAILAVTRAESPIACFTTNHGESADSCQSFRKLVERAGYIVQDIDLSTDAIPEDCRLLITYDPQTDFLGYDNNGADGVSEIDLLDKFLDNAYSFMLFIDDETPELPVLEEYLEEWGVTVCRVENTETGETDNYHIRDEVQRLDPEGYTLIGAYGTKGLGASVTKDMRSVAYPAKVVFPHATSVVRSSGYYQKYVSADESSDGEAYSYETYYRNGVTRTLSDVFTTYSSATAEAFGETYKIATEKEPFRLMTLTSEERTVQEGNYLTSQDRSFVCVVGSTEFASDALLDSSVYGNADVLVSALRSMGRELVPVTSISFKSFKIYDMDTDDSELTSGDAMALLAVLTLIPAVLCAGVGVVVSVRRKYR